MIYTLKQKFIDNMSSHFPEEKAKDIWDKEKEKFNETYKDECLKICGQEIMKWHLTNHEFQRILKDKQYYFIRAGEKGEFWKEFKTNNFVAVDYLDQDNPNSAGDFDLSNLSIFSINNLCSKFGSVFSLFANIA